MALAVVPDQEMDLEENQQAAGVVAVLGQILD